MVRSSFGNTQIKWLWILCNKYALFSFLYIFHVSMAAFLLPPISFLAACQSNIIDMCSNLFCRKWTQVNDQPQQAWTLSATVSMSIIKYTRFTIIAIISIFIIANTLSSNPIKIYHHLNQHDCISIIIFRLLISSYHNCQHNILKSLWTYISLLQWGWLSEHNG